MEFKADRQIYKLTGGYFKKWAFFIKIIKVYGCDTTPVT